MDQPQIYSDLGEVSCKVVPYLLCCFPLMVEGLSRALQGEKSYGSFKCIRMGKKLHIYHILLVHDIFVFYYDAQSDVLELK